MSEDRSYSRLSMLAPWERLLARFYPIAEASPAKLAVYLSLLGALSNSRQTIDQLIARLCITLPKVTQLEGVAVIQLADLPKVYASNLSSRRLMTLLNSKSLRRELQIQSVRRRISPPVQISAQRKIGFIVTESVGTLNGSPTILVGMSQSAVATEQIKFFELTSQILHLRLDQRKLEVQLNDETEQLRTLTHYLSEGLMILDKDLNVTLWNRPLERLTGLGAKTIIGKRYDEFIRSEQLEILQEMVKASWKGKQESGWSVDIEVSANSTRRWLNFSGSTLRNRRRQVDQVVIIVRDISHLKALEHKKNEFISIATHEFRTPLTVIKGYLSLLERERKNLNERQRTYLSRATEASNRLVGLAEDLLQVVQIEQNRLQVVEQRFELFTLLKRLVKDFKVKASQKGISITLTRPQFPTTVELDPIRTEQIFANLIDNALKYTLKGSVKIYFEQSHDLMFKQEFIITQIRDTGIGIAQENLDEIFEKFRRTHRLEQIREQGAGLGLFIVKSFIQKQGGKILVRSRPNHGTTFSVLFPLAKTKHLTRKERENVT